MPTTAWPRTSSLALGALPTAPSCARLHAGAILHEWGLAALAETVELVVSELMTNAMLAATELPDAFRRGLPVVHIRLLADEHRLIIEVWDSNPQAPVAKEAAPDEESGRGLMLVGALCERWGSEAAPGRGGKVVWAELQVGKT
jgi:anti-sigma regulatory factor (Ser/Thr protein kinase)